MIAKIFKNILEMSKKGEYSFENSFYIKNSRFMIYLRKNRLKN